MPSQVGQKPSCFVLTVQPGTVHTYTPRLGFVKRSSNFIRSVDLVLTLSPSICVRTVS